MQPIFAIGDIHGQIDELHKALGLVAQDEAEGPVLFIGDYVDRGPDSRAVIELLLQGQADGRPWICLKGNHDKLLLDYLADPHHDDPNIARRLLYTEKPLGGRATLASYGVDVSEDRPLDDIHADALEAVPQAHRDWLAALPLWHETEEHIFVHAGIRPGIPMERQEESDLLWIRGGFLEDSRDHGKLVVHGHTALDAPQMYSNRLNIDGGAGYGRPLAPVLLLGREAFVLGPFGRARL
ncbi:metallophosphoesterase family protein [Salipiger mucosus]|uniref:metallophosphoesterase family protein n=1 Tax=Salipiger mucosus TaxID=263378 RepID=UPI0003671AFF|nr:metallophosphoesterase family protein [Salipiger mucosus]